jgi:hypothetical protein
MRHAAQVAIRVVKWVALVCIAFVAAVVVLNLFDEELSPNVEALAMRPQPVPARDNAYLALLGIDAPAGVDAVDEGLRLVEENEREIVRPMADRRREFESFYRSQTAAGAVRPRGPRAPTCEAPALPCVRVSVSREEEIRAQLEIRSTQVDRYLQALQMPAFEETATFDLLAFLYPTGHWEPRRLLLMKAALDAQQGRRAEAVHFLTDDLRFWTSVLDRGSSLVVAMLAARAVRVDLAVLSELIGEPDIDLSSYADSIRNAATPSPWLGRGFSRTLAHEFELSERNVRSAAHDGPESATRLDRVQDRIFIYGMNMNATRNRSAEAYAMLQRTLEPMPASCPEVARLPWTLGRFIEWNVDWVYNPIGKWLTSLSAYSYPEYALRLCDTVAHMALVRAQLELRLAGASGSDIAKVLSRTDLANPHTGQPFDWADGARELSFTLMAPRHQEGGPVRASVPRQ